MSVHDESMIQAAGRLNGVNHRSQEEGTFIWGKKEVIKYLYKCFHKVDVYLNHISAGTDLEKETKDVSDAVSRTCNGGVVQDVNGINSMSHAKRTRPGLLGSIGENERATKRQMREREISIVSPEIICPYVTDPQMRIVSGGEITTPQVAVAAPFSAPEPFSAPQTRQDTLKSRVLECMKQIRDEKGENIVTLSEVRDKSPSLYLEIVDSHHDPQRALINDGKLSPYLSNTGSRVNGKFFVN